MLVFDAFFRFTGLGFILLLTVLVFRDHRKWRNAPYLILTCVSVSALFVGYSPDALRPSGPVFFAARLLDVPHLVFVWLFVLSLFEKDFQLKPFHVAFGFIYCIPILWIRMSYFDILDPYPSWLISFVSIASAALVVHLCFTTLKGRADDLMEKRRQARIYFVLVIVGAVLIAAASEPFLQSTAFPKETFKIMALWPTILWCVTWMTAFNNSAVNFSHFRTNPDNLGERDQRLHQNLEYEILEKKIYRDPDLNIVTLAKALGASQHRLRSLINQGLGYPNFSAYLNAYRLADAKRALADPEKTDLPILTISMDCGYKSLSSFNRNFKVFEDMTPKQYRRQQGDKIPLRIKRDLSGTVKGTEP